MKMNDIASVEIAGDLLWIGYGGATGGGLGQLDLRSRILSSYMPSLKADPTARSGETPPRDEVKQAIAGSDGDLWLLAGGMPRQFHVARGAWETLPKGNCDWIACLAANADYLIEGGSVHAKGGLAIENLRDHSWQNLQDADGIPNPPRALTLDGDNLWIGGEGAIAVVDLTANKVKKICRLKTKSIDKIQIAGGYVWAQFDWHLYRTPLSALQ